MADAIIIDGRAAAEAEMETLRRRLQSLRALGKSPLLVSIRVGNSEDAILYSRAIGRILEKTGLSYKPYEFDESCDAQDLLSCVGALNDDLSVTAVLLFSPLPKKFASLGIPNAIAIAKDVEGRRILTGGNLRVAPPTALSAVCLVDRTGQSLVGKQAVVVGRSDVVGKPAALLLLERNMTVTICHSKTIDIADQVRRADVLIVSVGKPNFIQGDWIKPGAIVIDVGENRVDGKLTGDVDFEGARKRAAYLTPVPGGVGPLTNVMLISNLLTIEEEKVGLHATL